jgi:hypothetical protein
MEELVLYIFGIRAQMSYVSEEKKKKRIDVCEYGLLKELDDYYEVVSIIPVECMVWMAIVPSDIT